MSLRLSSATSRTDLGSVCYPAQLRSCCVYLHTLAQIPMREMSATKPYKNPSSISLLPIHILILDNHVLALQLYKRLLHAWPAIPPSTCYPSITQCFATHTIPDSEGEEDTARAPHAGVSSSEPMPYHSSPPPLCHCAVPCTATYALQVHGSAANLTLATRTRATVFHFYYSPILDSSTPGVRPCLPLQIPLA